MSLTELLVPTYQQMLKALSSWLQKAEESSEEALTWRLAPDMFPLATQVRFACLQAQEAPYRLRGLPLPEALDELAKEGRDAGEAPGSFADAQARISEALNALEALEPGALDAGAERTVSIDLRNGMIFDLTGERYARDWALAQFYFHLMSAYAILRAGGVELGKADYVAHMFAYLRPGTGPQA